MSTKLQTQAKKDLDTILKLAAAGDLERRAMFDYIKGIAKPLLGTLAAVGASGGAAYYFAKKDKERHDNELFQSLKSLASKSPAFGKDRNLFIERFSELTAISPTIAKNPSLASKVLSAKLKSGFSVDDIHKLTSIEHNAASSKGYNPGAAGRASAGHALTTLVNAFGRDAVVHKKNLDTEYYGALKRAEKGRSPSTKSYIEQELAKAQQDLAKFEGKTALGGVLEDKNSVQRVSDECLGTMLAERYVLFKQAGLIGAGFETAKKGLQVFAPALALGGGIALVRHALESHRNTQLEAEADRNFAKLMRTSDVLKGPENSRLANEAFDTLKAVAPSLAAKPLVAKTFIEFTVNQGSLPPQTVQQLAEAEDRVRGIPGKSTFLSDLKSMTGLMNPKTIGDIERFGAGKRLGRK